jgi:hypothetical protein
MSIALPPLCPARGQLSGACARARGNETGLLLHYIDLGQSVRPAFSGIYYLIIDIKFSGKLESGVRAVFRFVKFIYGVSRIFLKLF